MSFCLVTRAFSLSGQNFFANRPLLRYEWIIRSEFISSFLIIKPIVNISTFPLDVMLVHLPPSPPVPIILLAGVRH